MIPHHDGHMSLVKLMIKEHIGVAYYGQSKDDIEEEHLKNRKYLTENNIVHLD